MSDTSPGTASGHGRAADGGGAPLLQARELSRTFGKGAIAVQALRGIDLSVRERTMVAIMGSSGSGKSTLLHLLGALDRPDAGTVAVRGRRYDNLSDHELTACAARSSASSSSSSTCCRR